MAVVISVLKFSKLVKRIILNSFLSRYIPLSGLLFLQSVLFPFSCVLFVKVLKANRHFMFLGYN